MTTEAGGTGAGIAGAGTTGATKAAVVSLPHAERFTSWFPDFLRKELAPYPGRGAIVARMVIAATLSAIIIVTFRIPGGAIGALCAFILSREDLLSTAKSALLLVGAFLIGGLFIPVGARMFASIPITHFLWEAVSLFLVFLLLKTLTNFLLAIGIGLVATNILSIWYLPGPAARNVELTLWQVAGALVGAVVTLLVEVVFHALHKRDEVMIGIDSRLKEIEDAMESFAAGQPVAEETARMLGQYAVVGVGALRRPIARKMSEPVARARLTALVSITGRSIDFAAALMSMNVRFDARGRERSARLAGHIAEIRRCLDNNTQPASWEPEVGESGETPLFNELETMMALIPSVLSGGSEMDARLQILEGPKAASRLFVADALSNPEHIRYALSGTMAAMACYLLYVGLDWPGLSTSVTTCVLTALTNIGASRQKQVLRIAGAMLGGFVFGLGSQIFVLPNIDSISGFAVLFATVSLVAAWVSTSSSRLSYAGLQIALAFYLVNLSDFSIQTSLTLARDRVIGVLLGSSMMWLVFERLYPRQASDEMVLIFIRNVRLIADLVIHTPPNADEPTILQIRRKREQIFQNFGSVTAQADAVPFETGSLRAGHMAARDRIRRWQTSLRTFYLLEAPLIQFRVFGNVELHERAFAQIEDAFRDECARILEQIAECLEGQLHNRPRSTAGQTSLTALLDSLQVGREATFSDREQALMRMSRTMASLVDRMQSEVIAEPLYATE
jgi:multidrug resistance protein MdtO